MDFEKGPWVVSEVEAMLSGKYKLENQLQDVKITKLDMQANL